MKDRIGNIVTQTNTFVLNQVIKNPKLIKIMFIILNLSSLH